MRVLIRKGNETKVSENFTEAEIHRASYGHNGANFFVEEAVLKGSQLIRSFFGVPARVNASSRTKAHELLQGRSGNSQHVNGFAIDLDFDEAVLIQYHNQIINKGELYHQLRQAGITGFGLYDGFLHIDCRPNGGKQSDEYGSFAFWDNRITTKKKV